MRSIEAENTKYAKHINKDNKEKTIKRVKS